MIFPEKIIIVSESSYFEILSTTIEKYFLSKGFIAEKTNKIKSQKNSIVIIINPLRQFNKSFARKRRTLYCAIQTEQIYNPHDLGFDFFYRYNTRLSMKRILNRFDIVYDFSPNNALFLSTKIKNYRHFHYGHSNLMNLEAKIKEEYDLFFIGSLNNRRKIILDKLSQKYSIYPLSQDLWGDKLYAAMRKSRICLNIHYDNAMTFESFRLAEYFANERFVMTEYIQNSYPFESGTDYIHFDQENLDALIEYYLKHPEDRLKIASNGNLKSKDNNLEKSIDKIYNELMFQFNDKQIPKKLKVIRFIFYRLLIKIYLRIKSIIKLSIKGSSDS